MNPHPRSRIHRLAPTLIASFLAIVSLPSAPAAPNLILILCDNLGYGDIEPFGSELHRTPHLRKLAAEGRKFTHFYASAGVCTPSRASLVTGCYAQRVGLADIPVDGHVLRPVSPYGLHPEEITVAEILQQAGYATTLLGKWHLGDQPAFLPTRQGFDHYYGIPYSDDMTAREWKGRTWPPLPLMEDEEVVEAPADRNTLTKRYTERALQFIEDHEDDPFFLFLSHAMPGSTRTPYASEAFRGESGNGPWGDSVEEIDWSTGQIIAKLRDLGIEENTLVIWTSDNGAPVNRDDLARGSNEPLAGRGYTTQEGGMRVPMIAWGPGRIPAGTVCTEWATMMDLLPTFAALAGAPLPEDRVIDGHDILPLLEGVANATTPYEAFAYYQGAQLQAVRSGPWKLFLPLENPIRHGRFRQGPTPPLLFHLVNDIGCETNLAGTHPDVVARLKQHGERFRADLGEIGRIGEGCRPRGEVPSPRPQRREDASPQSH